jgi:hypothetical protein
MNLRILALGLLCLSSIAQGRYCRFAPHFTLDMLMNDQYARDEFISLYLQGEADFLELAGLDHDFAVSYDGHGLHVESGELLPEGHQFSAASKESLHWGVILKIIEEDPRAKPFGTVNTTLKMLDTKMKTYEAFHAKYPGFGWFLPWYAIVNGSVAPSWDWHNRVPSLDNGQLFWGAFSVLYRLKESYPDAPYNLTARMQVMIDEMIKYAPVIFYEGEGKVRAVAYMTDETKPPEENTYSHQGCDPYCYLDDPYEGELFTFILYLLSDLPEADQ